MGNLTHPTHTGFFITLEGGEGTGKSTQIQKLSRWLRKADLDCTITLEPGATKAGKKMRRLLLDDESIHLSKRAELLLYEADRAQHVEEIVWPALRAGQVVVSDRFFDSSTIYQGKSRKLGIAQVKSLNLFATGNLRPDLTIVLDLPVEVGLKRAKGRAKLDKLEREGMKFHRLVRAGFLELAKQEPQRIKVVDARPEPDEVFLSIQNIVVKKLKKRRHRKWNKLLN